MSKITGPRKKIIKEVFLFVCCRLIVFTSTKSMIFLIANVFPMNFIQLFFNCRNSVDSCSQCRQRGSCSFRTVDTGSCSCCVQLICMGYFDFENSAEFIFKHQWPNCGLASTNQTSDANHRRRNQLMRDIERFSIESRKYLANCFGFALDRFLIECRK